MPLFPRVESCCCITTMADATSCQPNPGVFNIKAESGLASGKNGVTSSPYCGRSNCQGKTHPLPALWEWHHPDGWFVFDSSVCKQVEISWLLGVRAITLQVEKTQYNVNFDCMWLQNCQSKSTQKIRRRSEGLAVAWYWIDEHRGHRYVWGHEDWWNAQERKHV